MCIKQSVEKSIELMKLTHVPLKLLAFPTTVIVADRKLKLEDTNILL